MIESAHRDDRLPQLPNRIRDPAAYGIPWDWIERAAGLRGSALAVALAVLKLREIFGSNTVMLRGRDYKTLGLSRAAAYRGLRVLETAGLARVRRHVGRAPRVTIILDEPQPSNRQF